MGPEVEVEDGAPKRRATLVVLVVLVALVAAGAVVYVRWIKPYVIDIPPRAVDAGGVTVLVDGRTRGWGSEEGPTAGVGVMGELGLVGGRCVGFVGPYGKGSVIVWPEGTSVTGSGRQVAITSEGHTVHLGDQVEGGTSRTRSFPGLDDLVPDACRDVPMLDVGLGS
ncbi:hypothetical protein H5V45_02480 [Nocardioides sp. KIGAM211]|uniref:Uncharacterized protein n=1 Tax=Nocardioides luti TaxID=2761101 RepID=A0A7X0RD93_9ACTN|nr:hypothetical protein [Nocardioides luti]MBB6626178.1 hypothetical protein [Nocardioides luti]